MSNHDPVDEFVNGLRQKPGARRPPKSFPLGGMSHLPRNAKADVNGLTGRAGCGMVVVVSAIVAVLSFICGGAMTTNSDLKDNRDSEPQVVVKTVTVYVTEPAVRPKLASTNLPRSCILAAQRARQVLKQGSKLASSTDKALDILSEANQAALKGTPAELNAAVKDLRDLSNDLQADKVAVLLPYQEIMDGLATCQVS